MIGPSEGSGAEGGALVVKEPGADLEGGGAGLGGELVIVESAYGLHVAGGGREKEFGGIEQFGRLQGAFDDAGVLLEDECSGDAGEAT
jgi:hypothetical protein